MFRALTSPRMIGLHLLAIVAMTAAVLLGIWQYGAWQTHRENQTNTLVHAEPRALDQVIGSDDPYPRDAVGRPVKFSGAWLPQDTVLVAGRELRGRSGYWVVTPVSVCDRPSSARCLNRPAMLVVRGWTPRLRTAPTAPTGRVDVTGWLQPSDGADLPDPHPGDDVLPELRIASMIGRVHQDLYGAYVIAQRASASAVTGGKAHVTAPASLEKVTPDSLPKPETFTAIRNLLYAVEWWFFGGFAVFLWWRWCSDEVARVSTPGEPGGEPGSEPGGEPGSTDGKSARDAEVASSP